MRVDGRTLRPPCMLTMPVILVLMMISGRDVWAQWREQAFSLKAGWNAIYTHVAASTNLTLRQWVERDVSNPIQEVWLWQPEPATLQFLTSPAEPLAAGSQWRSWKRSLDDTVDNTLSTLPGNAAFLVRVQEGAADYTWRVTGRPLPPAPAWRSSGLNFIGFPTPALAPPTFSQFLAGQPQLAEVIEVFRYTGSRIPSPLEFSDRAATLLRRGEGFWVRSGEFFNRYFGPFEVLLQDNTGVHFGERGGQQRLRLKNVTPDPIRITLEYEASAGVPVGEEAIVARPTLLLRGDRDLAALSYGFAEWTGPVHRELAPAGKPGSEVELVLGLDRSQLAGEDHGLFAGILVLSDAGGLSQVEIPVTARKSSSAGLWVGTARVDSVRENVRVPIRGPDGANLRDDSPEFLEEDAVDLEVLAERLMAPTAPIESWLAGQLSASTRERLGFLRTVTFGLDSLPSSKYGLMDLDRLPEFVARLQAGSANDPVHGWFLAGLPEETRNMLGDLGTDRVDPRRVRAALIDGLNGVVVGSPAYEEARFAGVPLSLGTRTLLAVEPAVSGPALARLNRRLLDDAFGEDLVTEVEAARAALVADLNRILTGPLVYRTDRFAGVALSSDALRLVASKPEGEGRTYLNRLLLEEAFSGQLAPNRRQYAVRFGDFKNPAAMVNALMDQPRSPLAAWIWDRLRSATQTRLTDYRAALDLDRAPQHGEELSKDLAIDLSAIVAMDASIYEASRFAGVTLSTETETLRILNPTGAGIQRLNRLLLEDAFPGSLGPYFGRVLLGEPRTAFGGVARAFPLRLILHTDGVPGGVTRLLQRVYVGLNSDRQAVVTTLEAVLDPARLDSARRISAPHLPWSAGNDPWPVEGDLMPGGVLRMKVDVGHDDQASNPFLHTYHPDHDNRNALFDEELGPGVESYALSRRITLTLSEPGADFDARTRGDQELGGTYEEVLQILGRRPGHGLPDEVRTFEVRGVFALSRVHSTATLVTSLP